MAISKKDAKFVSDDESILVKSVLNSFEVFGKFPAKMRDIISRDIQVSEYMAGDVLCTYGEKASSAILILNGKVNLFRPFQAKTFEVKESAKLKRNSSSDFFDEMSQGSSILQNSGTVMDLGTKVNCEDIDGHIFDLVADHETPDMNSREIMQYYRQTTAIAAEKTICAIISKEEYRRCKTEYEQREQLIRMKIVRLIKGFGKHIFAKCFMRSNDDTTVLRAFVSTWKHIQYKANTIVTKEGKKVDRLILIVRGDCKSLRRYRDDQNVKANKLLEIDQFTRYQLAAGVMEITNGARKNIPLYKLRYESSLVTTKSMCEVYEIPADAFYKLCVDPRYSKSILMFCDTFFKATWSSEAKNIDTLREYKQWMKRRKNICKSNVGENERSKEVASSSDKNRQKWQITGGRYKPEEDYHRQHMLEQQERRMKKAKKKKKRKDISKGIKHSQSLPTIANANQLHSRLKHKSSLGAPVTSMSKPHQEHPKAKRRKRLGLGVNPAKQHHDIDENQLRELKKHFGFPSDKKKFTAGASLPNIVSKKKRLQIKERDERARKAFVQRKKYGRLYDANALRYWDPETDQIKKS